MFPREAKSDITFKNPIYDERNPPTKQSHLSKLFGFPEPIENQPNITIKKGTQVFVLPSAIHYDTRFWFDPTAFRPERWENDPFVLQPNSSMEAAKKPAKSANARINSRQSVSYGAIARDASSFIKAKSRRGLLENSKSFLDKQNDQNQNIRVHMFGRKHEEMMAHSNFDVFEESTSDDHFHLQKWSFMPFGLGVHACMGRRLALKMVDAILSNVLEHEATFYQGMVPSLFTSKPWYDRTTAVAAVYNMPADPAFISLRKNV